MSHPWYHAQSSARKFGGQPESYLPLHEWFDATKAGFCDQRHRAVRHHSEGIFWAVEVFGPLLTVQLGDGRTKQVPTRLVGEQHVEEDLGWVPALKDWLENLQPTDWMRRGARRLSREFESEKVEDCQKSDVL